MKRAQAKIIKYLCAAAKVQNTRKIQQNTRINFQKPRYTRNTRNTRKYKNRAGRIYFDSITKCDINNLNIQKSSQKRYTFVYFRIKYEFVSSGTWKRVGKEKAAIFQVINDFLIIIRNQDSLREYLQLLFGLHCLLGGL